MSRATDEINKVTGTVIGLSWKLILIAVVILLLIEGASKGYEFGYEVFAADPVENAPGRDITITVDPGESAIEVLDDMKRAGLIRNSYAALVASIFFDYDIYPGTYTFNTSMTSREMLEELNVRPEGYVEETVPQTEEETMAAAVPAVEDAGIYADEEPSEMVWEAVEAETDPEGEVVSVEEDTDILITIDSASEDEIEIRID